MSTRNLRLRFPRKLQYPHVGPFKVLKQVGPAAYKLELSYSAALKTIHKVSHISLVRAIENNELKQQPPPFGVNGQWEYELEAIVGYWTCKGQP